MSQIVSQTAEALEPQQVQFDPADEFAYRPVPPLAPISLFLAICASSGFLGTPCLAIGGAGIILGGIALWQIHRAQGEMGGKVVARLGTWLSVMMLLGASGYHAYAYVSELPEGYLRVNFSELSKYAGPTRYIDGDAEKLQVAPEVAELEGKPIYIKGYMYPTRQRVGLSEFVLVKDTGQCCFGGQPKVTDMIVVRFDNGMTVNHREQVLVAVAGTFRAVSPGQSGVLTAIYQLDARQFK